MQIFISYSSKETKIAEQICNRIEKDGVSCFIAPRDIRPGKEYAAEIINGLDSSSAIILLMSQNANNSPHVLREVEHAVSLGIPILVYKIEEVELSKSMEYFLMTHQWVSAKPKEDFADILAFIQDLKERRYRETDSVQTEPAPAVSRHLDSGTGRRATGRKGLVFAVVLVLAAAALFLIFKGVMGFGTVSVSVGETVLFGSYLNEDISWRVLKISEDKSQAILISADILTMKAFDAAEGGRYNYDKGKEYWAENSGADTDMALQVRVRGNSAWSTSNLRTWLNSETELVSYSDQPPGAGAMAEKKNGYQDEAGFLYGFTEEERGAIVEKELTTKGNALSGATVTKDKVWLLSVDELSWFDEAGMSKLASPTQAAVKQDQSGWYMLDYKTYGVNRFCWWLREPVEDAASKCQLVDNGYTRNLLREENAGLEGYGVRPSLVVDLHKVRFR